MSKFNFSTDKNLNNQNYYFSFKNRFTEKRNSLKNGKLKFYLELRLTKLIIWMLIELLMRWVLVHLAKLLVHLTATTTTINVLHFERTSHWSALVEILLNNSFLRGVRDREQVKCKIGSEHLSKN